MKENINDLLLKVNHKDGIKAPDGYFDSFASMMEQKLPQREFEAPQARLNRSFWQKVRPYVYMAAMFAGIWLMLHMFTIISPTPGPTPDSNPVLAEAIGNDSFFNETIEQCDISDYDIINDLYNNGTDVADIQY